MTDLIWSAAPRGLRETNRTPIEKAWHHALCCVLGEDSMAWWALRIVEERGAEA